MAGINAVSKLVTTATTSFIKSVKYTRLGIRVHVYPHVYQTSIKSDGLSQMIIAVNNGDQ